MGSSTGPHPPSQKAAPDWPVGTTWSGSLELGGVLLEGCSMSRKIVIGPMFCEPCSIQNSFMLSPCKDCTKKALQQTLQPVNSLETEKQVMYNTSVQHCVHTAPALPGVRERSVSCDCELQRQSHKSMSVCERVMECIPAQQKQPQNNSGQDDHLTPTKTWAEEVDEAYSVSGDALTYFPASSAVMFANEDVRRDVKELREDIQRHVPFLTKEELHSLEGERLLGVGGFGCVRLVTWENGTLAVVKELLQADQLVPVLTEASMLLQLRGAGGAPRLLGVCQSPPALVQEFVGHTYDRYLSVCSVKEFLASLEGVCHCLQEVHDKGVVHNDLKWNNITFTGTVAAPHFHIIDFGLASCSASAEWGNTASEEADEENSEEDEDSLSRNTPWVAPEVYTGGRVSPSGDVYSLGFLMSEVVEWCAHGFLTGPLCSLSRVCTVRDASRRPSLARVAHCISILAKSLTLHQLAQKLIPGDEEEDEDEGEGGKVHAVASEEEIKQEQDNQDDYTAKTDKKENEEHQVDDIESGEEDKMIDDTVSREEDQEEKDNKDHEIEVKNTKKNRDDDEYDDVDSENNEDEADDIESEEEKHEKLYEGNENVTEDKEQNNEDGEMDYVVSEEKEKHKEQGGNVMSEEEDRKEEDETFVTKEKKFTEEGEVDCVEGEEEEYERKEVAEDIESEEDKVKDKDDDVFVTQDKTNNKNDHFDDKQLKQEEEDEKDESDDKEEERHNKSMRECGHVRECIPAQQPPPPCSITKTWTQQVDEAYSASGCALTYLPKNIAHCAPSQSLTTTKTWAAEVDEAYSVWEDALEYFPNRSAAMITNEDVRRDVKHFRDDIQRHVPFLTREELHSLEGGHLLGVGGFVCVRLVTWETGVLAVVKELLQADQLVPVLTEASMLLQLRGVCQSPPALVQEFVGHTYDRYLSVCSVKEFLASLEGVCHCLQEVHDKGVVHNDLKWNNIMFTGTVAAPHLHIIDFGLTSCSASAEWGNTASEEADEENSEEDEDSLSRNTPWVAPDVYTGGRVSSCGDVYSLGFLMSEVVEWCAHGFLTGPLRSLSRVCTARDASRRPSLARVAHYISILAKSLTLHQLAQKFPGDEEEDEDEGEGGKAHDVASEEEEQDNQDDYTAKTDKKENEEHQVNDVETRDEDKKIDDTVSPEQNQEEKDSKDHEFEIQDTKKNREDGKYDDVDSEEDINHEDKTDHIESEEDKHEKHNKDNEIVTEDKEKNDEVCEMDYVLSEEEEKHKEGDFTESEENDKEEEDGMITEDKKKIREEGAEDSGERKEEAEEEGDEEADHTASQDDEEDKNDDLFVTEGKSRNKDDDEVDDKELKQEDKDEKDESDGKEEERHEKRRMACEYVRECTVFLHNNNNHLVVTQKLGFRRWTRLTLSLKMSSPTLRKHLLNAHLHIKRKRRTRKKSKPMRKKTMKMITQEEEKDENTRKSMRRKTMKRIAEDEDSDTVTQEEEKDEEDEDEE
ncbi:hypothetical protein O3P69_009987 [Scylla paramamosain]|uniref:Protein kinase domain-containing protein n=1 Tax=Scylla paramamosain TaxID=85552 RepID=A0AAW0SMW9_SCYPA